MSDPGVIEEGMEGRGGGGGGGGRVRELGGAGHAFSGTSDTHNLSCFRASYFFRASHILSRREKETRARKYKNKKFYQ